MVRIFRHYIPRTLVYLGVVEIAILLLAMYVGVSLRFMDSPPMPSTVEPIFPRALIFVLVMFFIMFALGLYQRDLREGEWGYFPRLAISLAIGLALMSLVFYVLPSLFLGRGAIALTFAIALVGLCASRYVYIKFTARQSVKKRVLVLGVGSRAFKLDALEKSGRQAFQIIGYLPWGGGPAAVAHPKLLPPSESLATLIKRQRVEEVVVAVRDRRGKLPSRELLQCRLAGVSVVDLPTFFERETGRIQLESLNPSWLIFGDGFEQSVFTQTNKRLFDVVVSLLLLPVALPLMAVTALLIYLEDKGPIFYRQERVGQHGRVFELVKFRSMRVDAEREGPQWAKKNDDRTTRVGRVIRKIRVDELPQIFNVLKGDMSFVGPRPERPYFVKQLTECIPFYSCRHSIKPGITGWAQVLYPYGASIEDAVEKLQYDLYYVKNNSLFLDIIILCQTVQVLLWNKGAR